MFCVRKKNPLNDHLAKYAKCSFDPWFLYQMVYHKAMRACESEKRIIESFRLEQDKTTFIQ